MSGLLSSPLGAASLGLKGIARVPGDKSISHRSLMFGALAHGETVVTGLLEGEDVLCTARALISMGAIVTPPEKKNGLWRILGTGSKGLHSPRSTVYLGNSGTSARLLMGVVSGYGVSATFTGDESLSRRPMGRVIKPLALMGATFEATAGDRLPIRITGKKNLRPIRYVLPVASAQVKSAILLAALHAEGKTTVVEPVSTRDHTERMLRAFGAQIDEVMGAEGNEITITGFPHLIGQHVIVPSDPSSAAFVAVAALICPGSDVLIPHVLINKSRAGLYETLIDMGGDIVFENRRLSSGEDVADLRVRSSKLKGVDVPAARVASMIDEFPVLSIAASFAEGTTRMTDLAELRVKESDRLLAIFTGLQKAGVHAVMGEDSLDVTGNGKPPQGGCTIETHLDHRIAMSFLVMGMGSLEPVRVDDDETINTSFPGFAALMNALGARITA